MRNRVTIRDLALLAVALAVLFYLAVEIDFFLTTGEPLGDPGRIEIEEALLLGAALSTGLLAITARLHFQQKREAGRRLAAEREARSLAYHDPLTGLANRRQLDEALAVATKAPPSAEAVHALLMLDLNGFKYVNDTYGHGTGDEVLVVVAQRLLRSVRTGDLVARIGGDEFSILARDVMGPAAATSIALRIIAELAEPIVAGATRHDIGTGIGIALMPDDATTPDEAMRRADVALYRAKLERRSAFRFFEQDMDRLLRERDTILHELRGAMENGRIRPGFRPVHDLRAGRVAAFALTPRWLDAHGELVPPESFLPVAEETGLVHEIARSILREACRVAAEWPPSVRLSFALLPGQIRDGALARDLLAILEASGLPPSRFEIEIPESLIVADLERAQRLTEPLADAGVGITAGSFGTGYSTLHHIRELRLDRIRIDRRLTEAVGDGDSTRTIRALAGLARGFGLSVSAVAPARAGEHDRLASSGIEEAQCSELVLSEGEARRLAA